MLIILIASLVTLVVVICVALVATSVFCVFHVVSNLPLDLKLGDGYCQHSVKCLFSVCDHVKFSVNLLIFINTQRFRKEKSRLVPMRRWMFWACVEDTVMVMTAENCIKVDCVAVKNRCLVHLVLKG